MPTASVQTLTPVSAGPRRDARAQLLDAAERLFARAGIGGVSLREVAAAAGQKNNSAVHYYFTDKRGLIDALLAERMGEVERLRALELDRAGDLETQSSEAILRMLWRPMLDLCVRAGGGWIVQFHLEYHLSGMVRGEATRHPILADPERHQASGQLLQTLRGRFPQLDSGQFRYRTGLVFMMFWVAASRHDFATAFPLDEVVSMATRALSA